MRVKASIMRVVGYSCALTIQMTGIKSSNYNPDISAALSNPKTNS